MYQNRDQCGYFPFFPCIWLRKSYLFVRSLAASKVMNIHFNVCSYEVYPLVYVVLVVSLQHLWATTLALKKPTYLPTLVEFCQSTLHIFPCWMLANTGICALDSVNYWVRREMRSLRDEICNSWSSLMVVFSAKRTKYLEGILLMCTMYYVCACICIWRHWWSVCLGIYVHIYVVCSRVCLVMACIYRTLGGTKKLSIFVGWSARYSLRFLVC